MTDVPRDGKGRLLRGAALGGGGRRSYPAFFTERGEDALAMLIAAATGVIVGPPEGSPPMDEAQMKALTDMALHAPRSLRIESARRMAEAIYGKPRDNSGGTTNHIRSITYNIVGVTPAQRAPKEVHGTVVAPD